MNQKPKNNHLLELLLGCFSILLIPIHKQAVVIVMLLWLLVSLINFSIECVKREFHFNKKYISLLAFPIFYVVHLIGLIYTTNFDYAFFDLEIKLSMLLIPLALWLRSEIYIDKQKQIFRSLIFGSLISFGINLVRATIHYHDTADLGSFFYTGLSPIHPSYMALYISVALLSIIYLGPRKIAFNLKYGKSIGIAMFVVLLSYLFLLSSKAGIITFTITIIVFITAQYVRRVKPLHLIVIILMIGLIPAILINSVPTIKGRFQAMITAIKNPSDASLDSNESSMERIAILKTSTQFALKNLPWGVGTGDIKDEISENYKQLGSITINELYLNPHNQFLQTTISLGILGLLSLLAILISGFRIAIKKKNVLFFSFVLLISLHFLFESMLEQQAGVVFITLFYSLFCIWDGNDLDKRIHSHNAHNL